MKAIRRPISSIFRGQAYTTRAATKQTDHKLVAPSREANVTRLPSGLAVVTLENFSPVSSLSVVYNAGPRYETGADLGLTHCLRMAVTQSAQKSSAFAVAKNIQQIGGSLSCSTTREHMIYTVQCLRSQLSTSLEYLTEVAMSPVFKVWELEDSQPRLKVDLEVFNQSLSARLVEALHKAVYRDGLGQSLYMSADRVGKYTPQALEAFVEKHYVSQNAAIVGIGVDHDALVHAAGKLPVRRGSPPTCNKAKFHGGCEVRIDAPAPLVHAALVHEGVSLSSADIVPAYVLQQAIGGAACVQHGLNTSSKLNKAAMSLAKEPFAANCITLNYTDSGLFGIQAVASASEIGKVLKASVDAISQTVKSGLTADEVKQAKARVQTLLESDAEDATAVAESLGVQSLMSSQPLTAGQLSALVDKVTADEVNTLAKKLTAGKPTMAAVGNLIGTPYLDELC